MKQLKLELVGLVLLAGVGPLARADAPLIYCLGTESGAAVPDSMPIVWMQPAFP
jgi:hypothetical protein